MDQTVIQKNDKKYLWIIGVLSVAIPVVVALLIAVPQTGKLGDLDVSFLPHLNAILNSATTLCLVAGFIAIKSNNEGLHRTFMMSAVSLSALFLVSYVIYHFQGSQTIFGDLDHNGILSDAERAEAGFARTLYLIILLTHIVLAVIVVPLVLLAIYFALSGQRQKHRNIVRYTFPVWTYVAVTGVVVYFMISPFYI